MRKIVEPVRLNIMRWQADSDLETYAERVLPWLQRDPIGNNVLCTILQLRLDGTMDPEPDALWLRTEGELEGVAVRTPPHGLLLSDMSTEVAEALGTQLAERHLALPYVDGPAKATAAFARAYSQVLGGEPKPGRSQRIFQLDRVNPQPEVPGRLREATMEDFDLLATWTRWYLEDSGIPDIVRGIDRRLRRGGGAWLWEVSARPVSMALLSPPVEGVMRLSAVYTPPQFRRRGYATACVAALSQHALDTGATRCMLYADLANPASNGIYPRIGYQPVSDVQVWHLPQDTSRVAGWRNLAARHVSVPIDPGRFRPRSPR